jgi:DNA-binding transcriptional ArsR family regulator
MIEALISSKTRIKLLLKFFLNSNTSAYLRGLEEEFGESSNAIRVELNKLEKVGMISSEVRGNKKYFKANVEHTLFFDINNIVKKIVGVDKIIENIVNQLGDVEKVYLSGDFAKGQSSNIIDLDIVGDVNIAYLSELVQKAEPMVKRKIKYAVYKKAEFEILRGEQEKLLIWSK